MADPVVHGGYPQGGGVAGQVAVFERGDGAPGRAQHYPDDEVTSDAQVAAGPVVLGETRGRGPDDHIGPIARKLHSAARAELGDPLQCRGGEQVKRGEIEEGTRGGGAAELADFDPYRCFDAVAQDLLRVGPVERRVPRRRVGQRHGVPEELRQGGVDAGVGAGHGGAVREGDLHFRAGGGGEPEHAPPQPRVLSAGDLAGLAVHDTEYPVAGHAAPGHVAGAQVLAEHRLDRVAPQDSHRPREAPLGRRHWSLRR